MLEPDFTAHPHGAELQPGQGIDGLEVGIGQVTHVAEHHAGTAAQLLADPVADRVDVGRGDVVADRESDRLPRIFG
jgi:hypothetical protein